MPRALEVTKSALRGTKLGPSSRSGYMVAPGASVASLHSFVGAKGFVNRTRASCAAGARWIDQRMHTSTFIAEQTLTEDTVPVGVDAVLFWVVWDAKKAALEVTSYEQAIEWAAQTALRDIIGKTTLADLLSNRQMVDEALQKSIDARSTPWGITVNSVEIRDIKIPDTLQDAMSRQAQAQRESQARVILGEAEQQIAESFVEAAKHYEGNPVALHLRAMNMLYEGLKEKGAMIVVPSTAVETMGLGTIGGLAALASNPRQSGPEA